MQIYKDANMRPKWIYISLISLYLLFFLLSFSKNILAIETDDWYGNIKPIENENWDLVKAKHLLERAGFGGTPEEINFL